MSRHCQDARHKTLSCACCLHSSGSYKIVFSIQKVPPCLRVYIKSMLLQFSIFVPQAASGLCRILSALCVISAIVLRKEHQRTVSTTRSLCIISPYLPFALLRGYPGDRNAARRVGHWLNALWRVFFLRPVRCRKSKWAKYLWKKWYIRKRASKLNEVLC